VLRYLNKNYDLNKKFYVKRIFKNAFQKTSHSSTPLLPPLPSSSPQVLFQKWQTRSFPHPRSEQKC